MLNDLQERAGRDPNLCYLEWSAPPESDRADREVWLGANPALPHMPWMWDYLEAQYRKAEISGIEFEGTAFLTDNLSAQASVSLLDPKIKEWLVAGSNVADQRRIQNTPETMTYLGVNYRLGLFGGTLNLRADWSYKSEIVQFETPAPIIDQEAYDLFKTNVDIDDGSDFQGHIDWEYEGAQIYLRAAF